MSIPALFFGGAGTLLRADRGPMDADVPFEMVAETNPIAPAGVGGEALFTDLYVVLTFAAPFRLRIVPILDGLRLYDEAVDLVNINTLVERQTHRFEIAMRQTLYRDNEPRYKYALRGTWFAVRIESTCPPESDPDLIIEGISVHPEIVSQGRSS